MEIKEWIMLASAIIVVCGWFINGYLNRKHEIFKKRLDCRLKMYDAYLIYSEILLKLLNSTAQDQKKYINECSEKIQNAQLQVLLYGTAKEIQTINELVILMQKNQHEMLFKKSQIFAKDIRANLRSNLAIKDL